MQGEWSSSLESSEVARGCAIMPIKAAAACPSSWSLYSDRTSPSECLIAIRTRCVCVLDSRCSGHSFCCAFPHPNPALHICSLCPSRPVASTSIIPGPAIPMKDLRVSRVSTSPHSLHFLFPHHTLHHVGSISQQDTRELSWGHRLSLLGWHS